MFPDSLPSPDESRSGIKRRDFLTGLGAAGALIALMPRSARAAGSPQPAAIGSASFVVFGDFGAGFNDSNGNYDGNPNKHEQAVADLIKSVLPPASGGYIVSVGDQVYVPYPNDTSQGNSEQEPAPDVTSYDQAVGYFYAPYILFPPGSTSTYASSGASQMNFYAMLGDHDWWHQPQATPATGTPYYPLNDATPPAAPSSDNILFLPGDIAGTGDNFSGYMQYFANQGEGSSSGCTRFYDFVRSTIHWIVLSSDANETMLNAAGQNATPFLLNNAYYDPAGGVLSSNGLTFGQDNLQNSWQGQWFQQVASSSASPWKFVATHYPPYSSSQAKIGNNDYGGHPSTTYMQWGYEDFGVDVVFSGHVHGYERLYANGVIYIVAGAGGTFEELAQYPTVLPQSRLIVAGVYGFLAAEELTGAILFSYYVATGDTSNPSVQDSFALLKGGAIQDGTIQSQNMIHVAQAGTGTLVVTPQAGAIAIRGILAGAGALTLTGGGELRLAAHNGDFTGSLLVQGATLRVAASTVLLAETRLSLWRATLDVRSHTQTFATPLSLAGLCKLQVNLKSRLHFADSRKVRWTRGARLVIEGPLRPHTLRFGTNRRGLTKQQLKAIRFASAPKATAALNKAGYLCMR